MKKQKKIHHILQSGDEAKEMKQSTFHMSYSVFRILKGLKFTMPPKISNYYLQKQDFFYYSFIAGFFL